MQMRQFLNRLGLLWQKGRKEGSERAVRYLQIASMVEEGGEAHTVNLCQLCNEQLVQQDKPRPILWQWRGVVEKKAQRIEGEFEK